MLSNMSANTKLITSQFDHARLLKVKGERLSEAYTIFNTLAVKYNHTKSMYFVGHMTSYGIGTDKDVKRGKCFLLEAAKKGHVESMYQFAVLLLEEEDDPQNVEEAICWLKKAASASTPHSPSILHLIDLHCTDEKNLPLAKVYLNQFLSLHSKPRDEEEIIRNKFLASADPREARVLYKALLAAYDKDEEN